MDTALEKKVEDTIRQNLESAIVNSVHIRSDIDWDGDPIFTIEVVVDSEMAKVDSFELVNLTRHVRSTLKQNSEVKFPIVTVTSIKDWKKLADEAA